MAIKKGNRTKMVIWDAIHFWLHQLIRVKKRWESWLLTKSLSMAFSSYREGSWILVKLTKIVISIWCSNRASINLKFKINLDKYKPIEILWNQYSRRGDQQANRNLPMKINCSRNSKSHLSNRVREISDILCQKCHSRSWLHQMLDLQFFKASLIGRQQVYQICLIVRTRNWQWL